MIAVESAHNIKQNPPGKRKPLQPKNIIISEPPYRAKPIKTNPTNNKLNKTKIGVPIDEALDACLADELNAVKKKLERLRLDKENTERMLIDRVRMLDNQMSEILIRGEFQKELEIGVDRLFRLKELHLASLRRSSIRSLREKEMEKKKNKETQSESAKTGESKEGSSQSCSVESIGSSSEKTSSSSTSTSTWTSSSTTASSRKMPIPLRWST